MTRRHAIGAGLLVAALGTVPGCGPGTASVAGRVTYQGKAVVSGSVTLKAADGSVHQAGLNPDGTYQLDRVPVGLAKVGVASPDPKPSARAALGDDERVKAAPPPPAGWFALPAALADPATSGVTLQVGGPGDIELK